MGQVSASFGLGWAHLYPPSAAGSSSPISVGLSHMSEVSCSAGFRWPWLKQKRYSVLSIISFFSRLTRKCPCVPVFKAENQKTRVICSHFSKPPFVSCLLMSTGQSKSYGLPKVKICRSQVLPARKSLLLNFQEFGKRVVKHSHYLKFNSYNYVKTKIINIQNSWHPSYLATFYYFLCS